MARTKGATTLVAAAAAMVGGLLVVSTVGAPASGSSPIAAVTPSSTTDPTPTSEPTVTTEPTTSTDPATTTTTTTTLVAATAPTSITASDTIVGVGGEILFEGSCSSPTDVFVEIGGPVASTDEVAVAALKWAFTWTAPTADAEVGTYSFRFTCGDPTTFVGEYPADLVRTVDIVSVGTPPIAPTTTTTTTSTTTTTTTTQPLVESQPPVASVLPETG